MKNQKWRHYLGVTCLFFTIITLAITLTINAYPLYVFDIKYLNILDWVDLSKTELLANYRQLMAYLNLPWVSQLKMTDFPVSASGAFHFYEVKRLFMLNYGVLLITLIPSVIFLKESIKQKRLWKLVRPFQIGALIPVGLGFGMLIGFQQFFETFHGVFFNNDDWLFDPATDPIINVLPEAYFMHCFILALVIFELIMLVGIVSGRRELKKATES